MSIPQPGPSLASRATAKSTKSWRARFVAIWASPNLRHKSGVSALALHRRPGPAEAEPRSGKISDASPLGRALLGKSAGDKVIVEAPDGNFEYVIISIT